MNNGLALIADDMAIGHKKVRANACGAADGIKARDREDSLPHSANRVWSATIRFVRLGIQRRLPGQDTPVFLPRTLHKDGHAFGAFRKDGQGGHGRGHGRVVAKAMGMAMGIVTALAVVMATSVAMAMAGLQPW